MPLAANAVATADGGQTLGDRRVGGSGDLSPIIYTQIVHHVPAAAAVGVARTVASDYSLSGGQGQDPPGGGGALPSSSTTMTTTMTGSGSCYSAEAEINHPGSSLSLDVAPSEYLERSLISSFRNCQHTFICTHKYPHGTAHAPSPLPISPPPPFPFSPHSIRTCPLCHVFQIKFLIICRSINLYPWLWVYSTCCIYKYICLTNTYCIYPHIYIRYI
jgi:hypothetical protein